MENSYLVGDEIDSGPMAQLQGASITYWVAVGTQQGRKVFTVQTLPAKEEQTYIIVADLNVPELEQLTPAWTETILGHGIELKGAVLCVRNIAAALNHSLVRKLRNNWISSSCFRMVGNRPYRQRSTRNCEQHTFF